MCTLLYCYILTDLPTEGYCNTPPGECRLIHIFSGMHCEASQYVDLLFIVSARIERLQNSYIGISVKQPCRSNSRAGIWF